MPKMVLKRPAGAGPAASTPSLPKKQKPNPVLAMCNEVSKGIQACEELPAAARQLIEDMMECSLGVYKSERHKYQENAVDMVADALAKVEAAHQRCIDRMEAKCASHAEEIASQKAKVSEEVNRQLQQAKEVGERKHALADRAKIFKSAKEAVMQAESAKTCSEKAAHATARKKDELETLMRDLAKPLIEGLIAAEEVSAMATKLAEALTKFGFGDSMVVPLPTVLVKAPAERGSFDAMVLAQLQDEAGSRLQQFAAALAEGEPERNKLREAVGAAQEAFMEARERQHESATAFSEANVELSRATQSLEAEQAVLKDFGPRALKNGRELFNARRSLERFREGALKTFAVLRDREPAPAPGAEATEPACDAATEPAQQGEAAEQCQDAAVTVEETV